MDDLPTELTDHGFTLFLANEFFDAFPIYKFVKVDNNNKWCELLVDIDNTTTNSNENKLRWIRSKFPTPASAMFAANRMIEGLEIFYVDSSLIFC